MGNKKKKEDRNDVMCVRACVRACMCVCVREREVKKEVDGGT